MAAYEAGGACDEGAHPHGVRTSTYLRGATSGAGRAGLRLHGVTDLPSFGGGGPVEG